MGSMHVVRLLLHRILDVVALCSEDFKIWLSGIQVLVHLGSVNAMKVGSMGWAQ